MAESTGSGSSSGRGGPSFFSWLWIGASLLWVCRTSDAAELKVDFGRLPPGDPPADFRAALTGGGPPPQWRLLQVDSTSEDSSVGTSGGRRVVETVLTETSVHPTDERFPLLIYEKQAFGDFTARLKFRTVGGKMEQMAGLAFRLQNETNYYVLRASSLGSTFRFYKVVDGARSEPIGPTIKIPAGEWHTLEVSCKGNNIRCGMDGKELIPTLTDSSFTSGRLALWTKSDSLSHFANLEVDYEPLKSLAERLVDRALDRYPRLRAVSVFTRKDGKVISAATSDPATPGTDPSNPEILLALDEGKVSVGSTRQSAIAVMPLRDRNGDPRFAVRLEMRTFTGQTDNNIAARGRIISSFLEDLVHSAEVTGE